MARDVGIPKLRSADEVNYLCLTPETHTYTAVADGSVQGE